MIYIYIYIIFILLYIYIYIYTYIPIYSPPKKHEFPISSPQKENVQGAAAMLLMSTDQILVDANDNSTKAGWLSFDGQTMGIVYRMGILSQMLHVWHIYLHWVGFWGKCK